MSTVYKIVQTSNFDDENYTEVFVTGLPVLHTDEQADLICKAINEVAYKQQGYDHPSYWKVVKSDYVLQEREA